MKEEKPIIGLNIAISKTLDIQSPKKRLDIRKKTEAESKPTNKDFKKRILSVNTNVLRTRNNRFLATILMCITKTTPFNLFRF